MYVYMFADNLYDVLKYCYVYIYTSDSQLHVEV